MRLLPISPEPVHPPKMGKAAPRIQHMSGECTRFRVAPGQAHTRRFGVREREVGGASCAVETHAAWPVRRFGSRSPPRQGVGGDCQKYKSAPRSRYVTQASKSPPKPLPPSAPIHIPTSPNYESEQGRRSRESARPPCPSRLQDDEGGRPVKDGLRPPLDFPHTPSNLPSSLGEGEGPRLRRAVGR